MDHMKRDCGTRYRDYVNRFSIQQFPTIAEVNARNQRNNAVAQPVSVNAPGSVAADPMSDDEYDDATATVTTPESVNGSVAQGASVAAPEAVDQVVSETASETVNVSVAQVVAETTPESVNVSGAQVVAETTPETIKVSVAQVVDETTPESVSAAQVVSVAEPESVSVSEDTMVSNVVAVTSSMVSASTSTINKSVSMPIKSVSISSQSVTVVTSMTNAIMSTPNISAWSDEDFSSDGFGTIDTYDTNSDALDGSDGIGTIDETFNQYVVKKVVDAEVEFHKACGTQIQFPPAMESEDTITDEDVLTPGQRQNSNMSVSNEQEAVEQITIEVDSQELATEESKRKRADNTSSEEDGGIVMKIGGFVNSFFHGDKRVKMEKKQMQSSEDEMEVKQGDSFDV